jgi:hypothetical protein
MEHLKYPQGRFEYGKTYSSADNQKHIHVIAEFPKELIALVKTMSAEQWKRVIVRKDGMANRSSITLRTAI